MRLTRLELKGFKSFKDKTVLEYPDKFMGIVGPNGSGKSNITEAICFVLGKSRGLRAANLQELIFNGGIGGDPSPKAVVAITLEEDNGLKHRITRVVDREGNSVYRLDDRKTTRQRIIEIAGDNEYNILLQDDVTKVVEMKPKDRRRIIDDLCGIGVYDEKKEKALRELEKVEERISQTHIILGEKQGYMQSLKKERDDALKFTKVRDELRGCRATLLNKDIVSLERRDEKLDELTAELKRGREDSLNRIAGYKSEIQGKNGRLREITAEMLRLEEERSGARIAQTRGEVLRFEDRVGLLGKQLAELDAEWAGLKDNLSTLASDDREATAALSELEVRYSSMQKQLESEMAKSADLTVETELDEVKNRVYEARSRIRVLKDFEGRKEEGMKSLTQERAKLEDRVKTWANEEQSKLREVEKASMEYENVANDCKRVEEDYAAQDKAVSSTREGLAERKILLTGKQSELQTIQRASGGLQQAVKALIGLKKVIPGIHGPVLQLGEVREGRYSLALQVAAGGRMQHIVVSSVNDAAKCIDYLRQKRIGRCTFLPLDKLNVKCQAKAPRQSLGFARDYIKASGRFQKVFEYVFGDTIIVKDIETAKDIGIGGWRMVTLDGDLMELSGAITGGHMPERYEITFSNTDELEAEIKALEGAVGKLESSLDEGVKGLKKLESSLMTLKERLRKGKEALDRAGFEKNIATERRTGARDSLNRVIESVESLEREMRGNSLEVTKLEKTVSAEEKSLAELTGSRGAGEGTKVDRLKDGLRDLEVEKSKLAEKAGFLRERTAHLKARMNEITGTRQPIEGDVKSLTERLGGLKGELEKLERAHKSVGGDIQKLVDERDRVEEELTQVSAKIGEIEGGMEGASQQMNEYIIEKAKITTRLEDLRREYSKYEGVQLIEKSVKDLETAAEKLEAELAAFGSVNMRAIETYDIIKREYDEISQKLETLKSERQSIFDFMDKVEGKKRDTFMEAFEKVKANFERIYAQLADGKGTLVLDNPMNISESGLIITASPGGKKLMSIDSMSGGEKVLTTSAFLLGLQQYKPSFFYVVDELDAALDKKNSVKLAEMLANSSSQFLMVTHNNNMLKYMDSAIGVSMIRGMSHIVGVRFNGTPAAPTEAQITPQDQTIEGEEIEPEEPGAGKAS